MFVCSSSGRRPLARSRGPALQWDIPDPPLGLPESKVLADERVTRHTREEWPLDAVRVLSPLFDQVGLALPDDLRVLVGFPRGSRKAIGQCFAATHAALDGARHIFISPVLDDPVEVLAVLTHELIHAIDDCRSGHRGEFARMACRIGLVGPMNATSPSAILRQHLTLSAGAVGPYPHRALVGRSVATKTQSTRMIKVVCPTCGYLVRATRCWLLRKGTPFCPDGTRMEIAERLGAHAQTNSWQTNALISQENNQTRKETDGVRPRQIRKPCDPMSQRQNDSQASSAGGADGYVHKRTPRGGHRRVSSTLGRPSTQGRSRPPTSDRRTVMAGGPTMPFRRGRRIRRSPTLPGYNLSRARHSIWRVRTSMMLSRRSPTKTGVRSSIPQCGVRGTGNRGSFTLFIADSGPARLSSPTSSTSRCQQSKRSWRTWRRGLRERRRRR